MNTARIVADRETLCRAVAGALAELSVQTVRLRLPGGGESPLAARTTDLPGLLRGAPVGAGVVTPDGATVTLEAEGCSVSGPGGAGGGRGALAEAIGAACR